MRLQLIWLVVISTTLSICAVRQPSVISVLAQRDSFFQWLVSIIWPSRETTTVPPTFTTELAPVDHPSMEKTCPSCRCGLVNTLRRIVGGQETQRHQYPWMVVVLIHGSFYCAGSLISDLHVLTAAHCVDGVPPELITLRFLEHNRSDSDAAVLERRVVQVHTHELYNPSSFNNDIALLTLDEAVAIDGPQLRPICLPRSSSGFEEEPAIVTGWGARREGGFATDTLQEVEVIILSQENCRNSSYSSAFITDNMICATYLGDVPKDACTWDSGGPLHVRLQQQQLEDRHQHQYQLAGIVSWGNGCARPDAPGVYTRVNRYLHWIALHTPNACMCTSHN